MEAEGVACWAGDWARIVVEEVVEVVFVFGVFEALRIWVGNQSVQGQRGYCVAVCGVEVHVFGEAVGVEEIVAGSAGWD